MGRMWSLSLCLGLLAMASPGVAKEQGPTEWSPYPVLRKEVKSRTEIRLLSIPPGIESVTDYPPTIGRDPTAVARVIPVGQEGATIQANGVGNYHWITAQRSDQSGVYTWTTAHHFSVAGPSPSTLLLSPKARLEMIPQPLPREFSQYRAGEFWSFLVRFDQTPLPNQMVRLFAPGQPEKSFLTNEEGIVQVEIPPFPAIKAPQTGEPPRRHRPPLQPFQLAVTWADKSQSWTTLFQYEYAPDPLAHRSPALGWLVTGIGMVVGTALWRPRKGEGA